MIRGVPDSVRNAGGLVYFDTFRIGYGHLAAGFCVVLVAYYLAWKYLVNVFNGIAGIA